MSQTRTGNVGERGRTGMLANADDLLHSQPKEAQRHVAALGKAQPNNRIAAAGQWGQTHLRQNAPGLTRAGTSAQSTGRPHFGMGRGCSRPRALLVGDSWTHSRRSRRWFCVPGADSSPLIVGAER